MRTYTVNGDIEITALDLSSAYEQANEMGIVIDSVEEN